MIAKTVDPSDRIALVVFSSAGKVLLHPTLMDAEGHAYLLKALDLCYPNGVSDGLVVELHDNTPMECCRTCHAMCSFKPLRHHVASSR